MWGRFLDSKNCGELLPGLRNGKASSKQLNAVLEKNRAAKAHGDSGALSEEHNLRAGTSPATMFLKPMTANKKEMTITREEQIKILRASELALQKQLVRVAAGAEATQAVVDILVDQGSVLRIERESIRLVSQATMNAAEELAADYVDAAATSIVWRSIANATMALGHAAPNKLSAVSEAHEKSELRFTNETTIGLGVAAHLPAEKMPLELALARAQHEEILTEVMTEVDAQMLERKTVLEQSQRAEIDAKVQALVESRLEENEREHIKNSLVTAELLQDQGELECPAENQVHVRMNLDTELLQNKSLDLSCTHHGNQPMEYRSDKKPAVAKDQQNATAQGFVNTVRSDEGTTRSARKRQESDQNGVDDNIAVAGEIIAIFGSDDDVDDGGYGDTIIESEDDTFVPLCV
jgi:hypothetical protein